MRPNPVGIGLHLALFGLSWLLFGPAVAFIILGVFFVVVHR